MKVPGPERQVSGDIEGQGVSIRRRFLSIPTLVSFLVAVAAIVFLATRFGLDWGETWESIRGMDPWLYAAAFALYYLSFAFRGLRWRVIVRNAAARASLGTELPSAVNFSRLILIGWFVNSIIPRLGDAYRAYALSQESRTGFPWTLGTVLAERVLDIATVFLIIVVAAITFSASTESDASRYILAAAALMILAVTTVMLLMRAYGPRLARFLPERLEGAYQRFHQGTMGSFRQLPTLFILGLSGWMLEMGRLYLVVHALGLSISLPLVALVALGGALLSTVPTPGGIGAVEPGATALLMLSLSRTDAVSVVLLDRSITYVSVIAIGGLTFVLHQMLLARDTRRESLPAVGAREQGTPIDG